MLAWASLAILDEAVQWFADDVLLSRALFLKAAREESLDSDPEIAQWEGRRRDALLLLALRQTAVKDQVVVEPEAVRKFYDDRPEMFTAPEEVAIQEIMVKTREEASALKEEVRRRPIWAHWLTSIRCALGKGQEESSHPSL